MEPLSCAASIIAVIQLTGSIVEMCGGYIKIVKNAERDILDLQQQISGLQKILLIFDKFLRQPEGQKLTTVQAIYDNATQCYLVLKRLEHKISPRTAQSSIRKWGLRAVKWPLTRKEVNDIIGQIERYESLFNLAMNIDQAKIADRIGRKIDLNQLKIACGAAFNSYENESDHAECLLGTRSELLRKIIEWTESSHGKCVFWLNGMAGTGKSTIARSVARYLHGRNSLGASFFFKRGEEGRGNAKRFFTTLAQQLAIRVPSVIPSIERAIEDDPHISEKSLGEQFNKLLLQPLLATDLDQITRIFIVIDALDECDSPEKRDDIRVILRLLPQVKTSHSLRLQYFLTSRPEIPIRLGLRDITGDYQDLNLHEVPKQDIVHDISLFLKRRLLQIQSDRSLPIGWPGKSDTLALISMSVPLFIYAATICRILEDEQWSPIESLSEILQQKTDNTTLDGTYLPILERLLLKQNDTKTKRLVEEYQKLLGTIILLESPLSVLSLSVLTGIREDSIRLRLKSMHSAFSIPTDDCEPVRMFHHSFRDFLLDPETSTKTPLWINKPKAHGLLNERCLSVMNNGLRKNICDLPDDGFYSNDINSHLITKHVPPELQYSCRYWIHHLLESQNPVKQMNKAVCFLRVHLLHWLEVMSLLGALSDVVSGFQRLLSVIPNDQFLEEFTLIHDFQRFISRNRQIADQAPLQIYSSSLIFSPRNSLVRQTFRSLLTDWNRLPEVQKTWGANIQTLEGHSDWVRSVTFSPDGQLLASASPDETVRLWDPTTGELQQTLKGHSSWVWSVTFSPDGQILASASSDKTIKLWDSMTGELQQTLEGHSDWVRSVSFSPDGQLLASASSDKTIKLWNAITGELQQTLNGHSDQVWSVMFSPDGRLLATASFDKTIKLWDPITSELQQTLIGHSDQVRSVTYSPDGRMLASASIDTTIKLWDSTTGELRKTLGVHSSRIRSVTFSPDGQLLASASFTDRTVKLWDPTTGELLQTLEGYSLLTWIKMNSKASIFIDQWICIETIRVLWLPLEYRPSCWAYQGGTLVLGHASGSISFISPFDRYGNK